MQTEWNVIDKKNIEKVQKSNLVLTCTYRITWSHSKAFVKVN